MPTASIVGITCFGTLFLAVVLILVKREFRPRYKRRRLRLSGQVVGCFLAGAAMFFWGALSLFFVYRSPTLQVNGTITHIRAGTGRSSSPGPNFDVLTDDGTSIPFSSNDHALYRMQNERVQVSYIEYDNELLDLQVLSGSDIGYKLHRSANNTVWWALALTGLLIVLGTHRSLPTSDS